MGARLTPVGDADAGFSLIELMVVVAILSVLSVTAGLSVARLLSPSVSDRQRFLVLDQTLRNDALLLRQTREMLVSKTGFAGLRVNDGEGATQAREQLWENPPDWLEPTGRGRQIQYLPDGRSTPLIVDFREESGTYRCVSDGWSGPVCERL